MKKGDQPPARRGHARRQSATDMLRAVADNGARELSNGADGAGAEKSTRFAEVVDRLAGGYKTISEMVYEVVKEAIVGGTFAPGEWLRQEWIAGAIGVSRIPVRTALVQLESEGLVELHPHRGARVRTLTSAQINEIFRLRALLEADALRRSMAQMTPDRIAELKLLAQQLDAQPEGTQFLDARVRFYRELYDARNNPLQAQMIEDLRGHLGRYLLGIRLSDHHEHHQHAELVAYMASGDVAGAESWLHAHLEGVRQGIESLALDGETTEGEGGGEVDQSAVQAAT